MPAINVGAYDLLQLPSQEDDRFEFKSSRTKSKELADKLACAVSGFANSGGGTFVAGVENKTGDADGGLVIEQFVGRQSLRDWVEQIIHQVSPTPSCRTHLVQDANGRGAINSGNAVLVVVVDQSHYGPHMARDHCYYIRAGAHTVPAPAFIVEALWAMRHSAKPRITHLVRQRHDDAEIVQIGLAVLTDSPAINVQLTINRLPGLSRDHNLKEFPVSIGVIDRQLPFFFDITTRCDAEQHPDEEFTLNVTYQDLAANSYSYMQQINVFRSLPSLRIGQNNLAEIARILKDMQLDFHGRNCLRPKPI